MSVWVNPDWTKQDELAEQLYLAEGAVKTTVHRPMIYAFSGFSLGVGKIKTISDFKPDDIVVDGNGASGFFGLDAFPGCQFTFLINDKLVTTDVKNIPAKFNNLIKFYPDPANVRTFVFETMTAVYYQQVKAEYSVWSEFMRRLIKLELGYRPEGI